MDRMDMEGVWTSYPNGAFWYPNLVGKYRRRFGGWELYTGYPVSLGYKLAGAAKGFIYHVELRTCQTEEEYEDWPRHLAEKGYNVRAFQLAIKTLRAEGKYLTSLKDK